MAVDHSGPPVLLRGGHVLLPDRTSPVADVAVHNGRISAIGPDLPVRGDEQVLDVRDRLVLPGFVDVHRHLWLGGLAASSSGVPLPEYVTQVNERLGDPFTAADIYAGVLWGAVQAINAGVTTVADWAHNLGTPDDIDANLRALADSGVRARFYFGGKTTSSGDFSRYADHARSLRSIHPGSDRIDLGLALRGPSLSSPADTEQDFALARELRLPISIHAGMAGLAGAVDQLQRQGLLGPDVNYAHASEFTAQEWDLVAGSGGTVSATPTVDLTMGLGRHPATGPALALGITVGLGVDTVAYGPTDLFGEMRLALAAERVRANAEPIGRGEMPTALRHNHFDLLDVATVGGARVLGLDDVGSVAVGNQADLITIDLTRPHLDAFADPVLATFLGAGSADVDTVIIGGQIRKRGGQVDHDLLARARGLIRDSRARILARAGL
jgi:5-methylthioadenosine/S-adenosylhomocysteine deaminase